MNKIVKALDRTLAAASMICGVLSGVMLVVVIGLLVADVLARNMFNAPIEGLVAYGQTALVALVFLALPYAQRRNIHVAMGLVVDRLPPRGAAAVEGCGLGLVILPLAYLTNQTALLAASSFRDQEVALGLVAVPVWPARVILTFGLALLTLEVARSAIVHLRAVPAANPENQPLLQPAMEEL